MVQNFGRQTQFINGINGVSAGGQATISMDVNKRYHRNKLQTKAVNYTGGAGALITALTGVGAAATGTLTVVNGVPTAAVAVAAGNGFVTGDTITIADATGSGLVGTVTALAGAITAIAVTAAGVATPASPTAVLSTLKEVVNGIVMRDCSVANRLRLANLNRCFPRLGELPLYYSEPADNSNAINELTSWDLFGQSTFNIQPKIAATAMLPSLEGIMEFDSQRNVRPVGNQMVPFLQPVAIHEFDFNLIAGLNKINTLPFDFPIRRILLLGSTPGNISQLEVYQDGNKVFEATHEQMVQMYEDMGFYLGSSNPVPTSSALYNPISAFDFAYIADVDRRLQKSLTCETSMVLRVTSLVQQSLSVVIESLPGQYAS